MPKTHRDFLKRKIGHAVVNLNKAGAHLESVISEFKPVHPEMAEGLEIAQELIIQSMQLVNVFALIAWNMNNVDWSSWSNEPVTIEDITDD